MLAEVLAGLEGSAAAAALRGSTWAYPLVNAAHILGIALLIGAIVPFDLRLIGLWRGIAVETLGRVLVPAAAAGLGLAAGAGMLLFIVKAQDYAASPLFRAKMAMLALGLVNVSLFHVLGRVAPGPLSVAARRLSGALSLALWPAVLVLGRLVGYF